MALGQLAKTPLKTSDRGRRQPGPLHRRLRTGAAGRRAQDPAAPQRHSDLGRVGTGVLMIEEKSHDTEEVSAQMSFLFANRL